MKWIALAMMVLAACVPVERSSIEAEPGKPMHETHRAREGGAQTASEPTLAMPTGHVVIPPDHEVEVLVRNTKLARLRLVSVSASDIAELSPLVGVHPAHNDPLAKLPRRLRARLKAHPLPESGANPNEIDVFKLTKGQLVLAVLEAPGALSRVALFQKGELSVLLKTGGQSGLVWVTSARTGQPVAGASVTIQQGKSVRHRVTTDREGIARLPAENRLRVPFVGGKPHPDFEQPLLAVARSSKRIGIASERWTTGIEPWQFSLPEIYYTGQDALRGSVTSERGMYRPGDSVHLLGVLRQRLRDGRLAPPPGAVRVRVLDPDENAIFDEKVGLSGFGTFREKVAISRTARLGRYSVLVERGSAELRTRFEVGEYRPARFEVEIGQGRASDSANAAPKIAVSARYLYGTPVKGGKLSWRVSARDKRSFGSWSDGYTFSNEDGSPELVEIASGEGTLDADGKTELALDPAALAGTGVEASQAVDLVVEATVRDAAGDSVSTSDVRSLVRDQALVGVKSDVWVVDSQKGWPVSVLATNAGGVASAGHKIRVRLLRQKWTGARASHGGDARYQGGWQEEVVATRQLVSAKKPVAVHFTLPAGGKYRVEAGLEGGQRLAAASVWAYGKDAYGGVENHSRIELHADKSSYLPGERARLFAEVPYEKAWALVTLEREGVLEARTMKLDGAGTPIELAIAERAVPNVFASVAVVPAGPPGGDSMPGSALRIGYRELSVSAERRKLRVAVEPSTNKARPGDSVDVQVSVTDTSGRPARAEVTLWAADEGVLMLTGYATPDPFVPAYQRHSHQVRTAASLLRVATDVGDEWSEYGGDDAPMDDSGAAFRSRFLGTAYFSKGIVTDARGRASVKVPLPDNLTRWRVMAAVADRGERFGSAQASIETGKPLQIEPALPRFLTRGDTLDATVMVENRTGAKGTAEVSLSVSGAKLEAPNRQTIELPPGAQKPVRFALRADQIGKAKIRASAVLGKERDAFAIELPVHAPTLWQTELIGEGRLEGKSELSVALPSTAEPGLAELVVNVAPGVLASIGGGVDALIEYPHGCVEQTTSGLIPMVLLEEVLRSSGDPRLAGAEHRRKMEAAIAHVLEHQNADGGFGLWPSTESEGFLTAYALWGLITARDNGYRVPAGTMRHGLSYLQKHANEGDDMHGQFSPRETRPFAAFVLAAADQEDRGLDGQLIADKDELSRFGLGLLGAAFAEREQKQAEPLLEKLARARQKTASGALIVDPAPHDSGLFDYGRDLRATAALVRALTLSEKSQQADDLVVGILGARRADGTWGTTYNNLWALHALVDYAKGTSATHTRGRVKLALDASPVATLDVTPKAQLKTARVTGKQLPAPGKTAALALSAPAGARLRFTARLRWTSTVASQMPIDKGFSVKRELFDAKSGAPVTAPKQGQLLRVRLTLTTREERAQVALVDRLPAGFEAVDSALATSERDPRAGANLGTWVWRELHDERVTHFADALGVGTHTAEYLVRATRTGKFLRPAPSAEAMYSPDVFGHGAVETVTVVR